MRGVIAEISSAAPWRERIAVAAGARSDPPLQKTVARRTSGIIVKFPMPRSIDINVLRAGFDCRPGSITPKLVRCVPAQSSDPALSSHYLAERL